MYRIVRKPKINDYPKFEGNIITKKETKTKIKEYLKERFPYLNKYDIKTFYKFVLSIMEDYDMLEDHAPESIGEIVDIMLYDPLVMQEEYSYENHIQWMDILSRIKIDTKNLK